MITSTISFNNLLDSFLETLQRRKQLIQRSIWKDLKSLARRMEEDVHKKSLFLWKINCIVDKREFSIFDRCSSQNLQL